MTEDISNAVMLSVTICLLCVLITAATSLAIIGNGLFGNFVQSYVQAAHTAETSVVSSMKSLKSIGAASAYKLIEERIGKIKTIHIQYKDGTATVDHTTLLKRASANVSIKMEETKQHQYIVTVKEVY